MLGNFKYDNEYDKLLIICGVYVSSIYKCVILSGKLFNDTKDLHSRTKYFRLLGKLYLSIYCLKHQPNVKCVIAFGKL